MVRTEKRSFEALDAENLPIHNAGEHSSPPPPKRFLEVACQETLENTCRKNPPWVLARLHAGGRHKVSGWTTTTTFGDEVEFPQDNVGYLPTINTPEKNM